MNTSPTDILGEQSSFIGPEQKKQKKLLIILLIVVVAIPVILYFGLRSSSQTAIVEEAVSLEENRESTAAAGIQEQVSFKELESISLDFSIFDHPAYSSLVDVSAALDISGERGRNDPFVSY